MTTERVLIGITVNGTDHELTEPTTVAQLLAQLGLPDRGVAVAVDGVVLARADWDRQVGRGAAIDVLTAVQGG